MKKQQPNTFTLCGRQYTVISIERDTVALRDLTTGKVITYGLKALQRTLASCGKHLEI